MFSPCKLFYILQLWSDLPIMPACIVCIAYIYFHTLFRTSVDIWSHPDSHWFYPWFISISKYLRFRSFLLFLPSHKLVWQFKGIILYLVQKSLHDEDFSTNFLCWLGTWELRVTFPCPPPLKWGRLLADNQLVLEQLQGRIIFLLADCETSNTSYYFLTFFEWFVNTPKISLHEIQI